MSRERDTTQSIFQMTCFSLLPSKVCTPHTQQAVEAELAALEQVVDQLVEIANLVRPAGSPLLIF